MDEETVLALKTQQEKYEQLLNLRNDEVTELVDSIVKENCSLKRQLVLNEIDIAKYQEMLSSACIKYYNLESGNLSETDRTYFEAMRSISIENAKKINEITSKYDQQKETLIKEHEMIIKAIKSNSTPENTMTIESIKDRVDSYETKMKTVQEALFNAEKYCAILQTKYESLLNENKYIKEKIPEEKNALLFAIEEIKKNENEKITKIQNEFKIQSDLITQQFIAFSNNEKDKENFILENLFAEKNYLKERNEKISQMYEEIKKENEKLKKENLNYERFISNKELEMNSMSDIKAEYENNLKKSVNELSSLKKENLELKNKISDLNAKCSSLEKKNEMINSSIKCEIENINAKNKKIIDDLNSQLLSMDQKRRELTLQIDQSKITYDKNFNKIKDLQIQNETLQKTNNDLKAKLIEAENVTKTLNANYTESQQNFKKLSNKYEQIDKMLINADMRMENEKKKFFDNETQIKQLQSELKAIEASKNAIQIKYDDLFKQNLILNQNSEAFKLNANFEISKLKATITDLEKKLKNANNDNSPKVTEWNSMRKSIKNIYEIYTSLFKPKSSIIMTDEYKMLSEIEISFANDVNTAIQLERDKYTSQIEIKDKEINSLKSKINTVIDIANTSKAKNAKLTSSAALISSIESNNQLTQFYENLLIHIQTTNILHMIELFSANLSHEDEIAKIISGKGNDINIANRIAEMQTQLDVLKANVDDTFNNLEQRSTAYVTVNDYEKFVEEYKASLEAVTHNILNSFLEYKKEQNESVIVFYYPIPAYNAMLDKVMNFVSRELEKQNGYVITIRNQSENIVKAVDAVYSVTSSEKSSEIVSRLLKEKFI